MRITIDFGSNRAISCRVLTPRMERILSEIDGHELVRRILDSPGGEPIKIGKYTFSTRPRT